MSRSLPYAVFAEIPPIWKELITACQNMTQSLAVLHMIVKTKENLQLALAEMQTMLTEEMRLGSEQITFDSFFSTKPGIKNIRGVIAPFEN